MARRFDATLSPDVEVHEGRKPNSLVSTQVKNAWVKDTKTAMRMKRRAFELLGFDHYDERMADGLQVLRYNNTNGYAAHKVLRPAAGFVEGSDGAVARWC